MNYYDLINQDQARLGARPGLSEFFMGLSASTDIAGDKQLLKQSINDKSRQDMQVGSSLFAMACPLNPFGMFLGMLMLNHFEQQYRSEHLSAHEEMLQRRIEMAQALAAIQTRRVMLDQKEKNGGKSAIETIDSWISRRDEQDAASRSAEKKEELRKKRLKQLQQAQNDKDTGGGAMLPSAKSHTQVSKLLKAKSALESQKFQLSKNQDYHGNASVSAKIDVLDSILKRI